MRPASLNPPAHAARAMALLLEHGYPAYYVGGCVRDRLLRRAPEDWDIATAALPEEVRRLFARERVVTAGMRHGTVTPVLGGHPVEITTYRLDGAYGDGRRPDSVVFTPSLREDLARRDFTINAMALSAGDALIDPFGGQEDLAAGVLRCVGVPERRFNEDGLRIVRGLRFASVLSLTIEAETAAALRRCAPLLRGIAVERVFAEFAKLLCGPAAASVLREFRNVFEVFLPELAPMAGFLQHSRYHVYDVWEHTLFALNAAPPVPELRLALLLHDVGKPQCFSMGEDGHGHFYGHQAKGAQMAEAILTRLRADTHTQETVCALVKHHDLSISSDERRIKRWLNRLGEPLYRMLLQVNRADTLAHSEAAMGRLVTLAEAEAKLAEILAEDECFTLKSLAVNGNDLLALGVPRGTAVGAMLRRLLDAVIDGECQNERTPLLALAKRLRQGL